MLVYHPCTKTGEDELYLQFLEMLNNVLGQAPAKSEIVMGANMNSNIGKRDGIHSTEFCAALEPHGLPRRNMKGESLLHIYLAHRLRVMNTFFKTKSGSPGHSTWTSNRPTSSGIADSHMLDLIVCSAALHKPVCNCCTTLDGLDSDHRAVSLDLNLTSIKYKVKSSLNHGDIDWRKICEEDTQRKLYNKYLLRLISRDMSYKEYCKAIVRAGKTTVTVVTRACEGWYRASKDILAPAIQEKKC